MSIEISLTQFIDFSLKQGISRVNFVKQVRDQEDYHPAFDYWRELRESIKELHENAYPLSFLDSVISRVHDKKKIQYLEAVKQYKRFCKNKEIEWFDPGKAHWTSNGLYVRSSPELGLIIDGIPHYVKLYFKEKSEKLDKRGTSTALTLLSESTFMTPRENIIHSVLNIKKNRLFPQSESVSNAMRLSLEAEAQNLVYIWNNL